MNALEENRFEQIGVPVFIKGYLKQYGSRLGLDVRDLLALYYKQTTLADVQIQPSRSIKLRDERQITSWVLAAIVLLLGRRRARRVVVERRQLRHDTVAASTPAPTPPRRPPRRASSPPPQARTCRRCRAARPAHAPAAAPSESAAGDPTRCRQRLSGRYAGRRRSSAAADGAD